MHAMTTAPRDGTTVLIRTWSGDVPAYYLDCAWLRADGEDIPDCWRPDHEEGADQDSDIELKDALGWAPAH